VTGRTLRECDELLSISQAAVGRLASDPRTGALVVVPQCRYVGGSGLDIEASEPARVDLIFGRDEVRPAQGERLVIVPYSDLISLEVGQPAVGDTLRSKTKSAAVRVGTTAALGVVLLPVALPLLFVKGGRSTGFALRTASAELFLLHVSEMRPEEWRMRLSEVFVLVGRPTSEIGDQAPETPREAPPVAPQESPPAAPIPEQIRQLAELHAAGALTDEEFSTKKTELLARM
jgi:hypothetical protein